MSRAQALTVEIETTLGPGPSKRGNTVLRSVTDLFINRADEYSDEQVAVFDDVMECLLGHAEQQAKAELSSRLAPVPRAPKKVVHTLLTDRDPAVSNPMLHQSSAVSEADLNKIIKTADKDMLMMIAKRPFIPRQATEGLLARAIPDVTYAMLGNDGAELSEAVQVKLIGDSGNDPRLAALMAARKDLPEELRPFLDAYAPKAGKPAAPRLIKSR